MFKIIENKKAPLCKAYRCQNMRAENDRFCYKHRKRFLKETKPVNYYYTLLKSNAKHRGKEFNLTLEEFKNFCAETGYMHLKGKSAKSASIDRINNLRGYEMGNIQVLTLSQNTCKRNEEDEF